VKVNNAPGTFFVKDGMIVTTGVPTGILRTDRMYENFVLELEWRHMKPKGNSGVFVWADPLPAVGTPFTRAIEVQVLDGLETKDYTSDGDLFSIWGACFRPDRPHPSGWERCLPSEKRAKPSPQWNHYRVECNDGVIKLAVNGKVVSGGGKARPRKGYLCLEAEGSECHFRNLKIKELPSTKPKPEEVADEAKGFVTLFSGLDLAGWAVSEGEKGRWKAQPGPNVLAYDGKGSGTSSIATAKEFADFELVCDVRLAKGTGSAFAVLRGSKSLIVDLTQGDPGRWKRFHIVLKGDSLSVKLNGKALSAGVKLADLPAKGPILLKADRAAQFCNLFIRELK
jgi:hypothetical protein